MNLDEYKTRGNEAFKKQKYQEAINFYTKAIEIDSASANAGALFSNRAASYTAIGNYFKALEDAESCIRVRPDWLKGYFRKGVTLEALKRFDESTKAYQDALKVDPGNTEVQDKLSTLNDLIKRRNESANPRTIMSAEEARTIGNSIFGLGKYDQAIRFYERAAILYKNDGREGVELANCYSNMAACHQQTHLYQTVIECCNKALAIEKNHVKALLRRAIAYEGMEKWKLALEDYNHINRLSPGMINVSQGIMRCQRAVRA